MQRLALNFYFTPSLPQESTGARTDRRYPQWSTSKLPCSCQLSYTENTVFLLGVSTVEKL